MWNGTRLGAASVLATVTVFAFGGAGASAHDIDDCTIIGTAADDTIDGTEHADVICGLGGNDEINGNGGADKLFGGHGKDRLAGDSDRDRLDGGGGDDKLYSFGGDDHLEGDDGDDVLHGGNDDDTLAGGIGTNTIGGGAGAADKLDYSEATDGVIARLTEGRTQSIDESGDRIEGIFDKFEGIEDISATRSIDHLFWSNATGGSHRPIASTVKGHAGDDFIATGDGDGLDTIDCGEGDDVFTGDLEDAASNCEDVQVDKRTSDEYTDCTTHAGEPHNIVTESGQHATVATVRVRCVHGHARGSVIIAALHPDDTEDKSVAHKYCPIDEIKDGHEYTCLVAERRTCNGEVQRRRTEGRLAHTGRDDRSPWFSYRCE